MNFFKNYSKLLTISSRGFRSFSTTVKYSNPAKNLRQTASTLDDTSDPQSQSSKSVTTSKDRFVKSKEKQNSETQSGPEHFISTDTRFNAFASAGPVSGFRSPGTDIDSLSSPIDNADLPLKQFVDTAVSTAKGVADLAADTAHNFINLTAPSMATRDFAASATDAVHSVVHTAADVAGSSMKGLADTADALNPFQTSNSRNEYHNNNNRYGSRNDILAGDVLSSAVQGFTNLAGSVASTFIPGLSNPNTNSSYYNSNQPRGNNRGTNFVGSAVNATAQNVADAARGLADVVGTVASNVIPGIEQFIPRASLNKSTNPTSVSTGKDFVYTGSQVEDMTFTDANKKGEVSSDSTTAEKILDTAKNVAITATAAVQDALDMASSTTRKFASDASKGAVSSANEFATAAGSAALSAAASAARRFNAIASATDIGNDEAHKDFIYTGTQVKEELTFTPSEAQSLEDEMKNIRIQRQHDSTFDIVISGAGISGSALACALGHYRYFNKENKRILVIDPRESASIKDFQDQKASIPDQKVIVLSLSSVNFLKEIGVWSLLNRHRIGSIHQMQIWETGGNSFVKLNENPSRELGYAVEATHLQAALYERIQALENIKLEIPNKITDVKKENSDFAAVILDDEAKILAKLVVGSDGQNSIVKEKAKIASTGWSPHQHGIICTVKTHYHNTTAWQRFLSTGSLAILPLWDEYSSVIWSCETDMHQALMQASDQDFLKELNYNLTRKSEVSTPNIVFNQNAGFDLPPAITEVCNKRKSSLLRIQQSNKYVAQRIALIGDSAHTIHPLAGQGINMGLTDSAYLANVIIKNLKAGNDIGNVDLLKEYEAASINLNTAMMYSVEFAKRSYESSEYNPLVFARNFAVSAINNFSPIKSLFVDVANGKYFQPTDYEWKTVG